MKVVVIGTLPSSLTNFRGELLKEMIAQGHVVYAMASGATVEEVQEIKRLGVIYRDYHVVRSGLNPFQDAKSLFQLINFFNEIKPDIVLAYTIKPIIWAGIAARITGVPNFHGLVTGLGYVFQGTGGIRSALKKIVTMLYKLSLNKSKSVIFQNHDNRSTFLESNLVAESKTHVVSGSGINLTHFKHTALPKQCRFLLIARLLRDKGIYEYIEAAKLVKEKYPEIHFDLVGPVDPSPNAISLEEVQSWHTMGIINYCGEQKDVRPFIESSSVFVLPSYHEGVPRTVLEAMSMRRPILTTDAPGCRETVKNGVNGWLVDVGSSKLLAEKMIWFVENQSELENMATESLKYAEDRFDVKKVNSDLLKILGLWHEKSI